MNFCVIFHLCEKNRLSSYWHCWKGTVVIQEAIINAENASIIEVDVRNLKIE
jgi:hypothetical protein